MISKGIHGATICEFRGTKGMIIKDMELCACSDPIGDCTKLRKERKCKQGFE